MDELGSGLGFGVGFIVVVVGAWEGEVWESGLLGGWVWEEGEEEECYEGV